MKSLAKFSFLLPLLLIYSCGGGGGSSDSNNGSGNGNATNLPVINSFSSDQTSVVVGNSITLSWTTSYATTCVASGSWGGARATNGSETLIMSNRGTFEYFLVCTNSSGSSGQKSVSIEVTSDNSGTGNPYDEDKPSYCRATESNGSNYWLEEFDSNVLNTNYFSYQVGNGFMSGGQWVPGWGNDEEQYYTSCQNGYSKECDASTGTTENTFIENGYLKIQPIYWNPSYGQTPFDDPYCANNDCSSWGGTFDYTSGKLITSDKFSVSPGSEVTVCFKVPEGSGHWPAFWMMPQGFESDEKSWPRDGEIDIMEHMYSNQDNQIQSTVHYGNDYENHKFKYAIETVPQNVNFVDKFHSITFKWVNNKLEFYLDTFDQPFHSLDYSTDQDFSNGTYWPFNEPFYLIMNVAVGGTNGGFIDNSKYCQDAECSNLADPDKGRLLIDYIEVKNIN